MTTDAAGAPSNNNYLFLPIILILRPVIQSALAQVAIRPSRKAEIEQILEALEGCRVEN